MTRGNRPPPGPGPSQQGPPPWLAAVRETIHANFRRRIRVSALAEKAGVHPVHVARVFRRHQGRTIAQYVHDLRIEHARAELLEGRRTIASIAHAAGFSDQAHFSRRFKERLGMPPGTYRSRATAPRAGRTPDALRSGSDRTS